MKTVHVGLIGVGGMGRTHFACYGKNPLARVTAICDVDDAKLSGDWSKTELNIATDGASKVDLGDLKTFGRYQDLVADPEVDLVDICLPTFLHAPVTVAALRAGKHVVCEKPMALNGEECRMVEDAARESGKELLIAQCLRYWPEYLLARQIIASGEYGRPLYAGFSRTSGTPWWSWNDWMRNPAQSGGVVLDMHVHDVDAALWWFGQPKSVKADGIMKDGLALSVDATWRYDNGLLVSLHSAWDDNGGAFHYNFKVVLEGATILREPLTNSFKLITGGKAGDQTRDLEVGPESPYQLELDDMVACIADNRKLERVTPEGSRRAVEVAREELTQIEQFGQ